MRQGGLLSLAVLVSALALAGIAGSASALTLKSQSFVIGGADNADRLTTKCPKKRLLPYSGGMFADPIEANGAGIYPHSYERLGVQRGWHVSAVLFGTAAPHTVTLQVLCGARLGPVSSPHTTVFVRSGETRTAIATCPPGHRIYGGGFQRTNFNSTAGAYITESRAAGDGAWQVSGSAFGPFGGELTAIAYCLRSGAPLVSEISADAPLPSKQQVTATTPACPVGTSLLAGGWSTAPSGPAFIAAGFYNPQGSWSTTAFNEFGPDATLKSLGYCMSNATLKKRAKMHHKERVGEKSVRAPAVLDTALRLAIQERVFRNGCYPPPGDMVGILRNNKINADQAANPKGVKRAGIVYVLSEGASCDNVLFAARRGHAVIVLNSATGEVRQIGKG